MKILFLVNAPKVYTGHTVEIDRPDLTRRLDCINTWIPDVLEAGHEVLFYTAGADTTYYDEEMLTLYIDTDASYDYYIPEEGLSPLFNKTQLAYRWILENRKFDIVFSGEDDMYINLPEFVKTIEDLKVIENNVDFLTVGGLGGGGFLLSEKALNVIASYENTSAHVTDIAHMMAINDEELNVMNHMRFSPFYFPAELFGMMHYIVGKKMYMIHNILKYYRENGYTNRKIILGSPLNSMKLNDLISYETTARQKTPRWYDFTTDHFNWEYHCGYPNSSVMPVDWFQNFWPYAENATKYFVLDFKGLVHYEQFGSDKFFRDLDFYVTNCERSLIDADNLILKSTSNEHIDGWKINNKIKDDLNLTFEHLSEYNFYTRI